MISAVVLEGPKMTEEATYHKKDIAKAQLETAVRLFLQGRDLSSVITLAGASGTILDRLLRNAGKEPFVDYARRFYKGKEGYTPKRASYAHYIDNRLGIIVHKHMNSTDSNTVELDLDQLAFDALGKAMSDYVKLNGQDEPLVIAFFNWAWVNKNGAEALDIYLKQPDEIKPK